MDDRVSGHAELLLAALKPRMDVVLLGTASAGEGVCRATRSLWHSGVEVRYAWAVTLLADGRLLDGRGVEPDSVMEPTASDADGRTDNLLEEALDRLRRTTRGDE